MILLYLCLEIFFLYYSYVFRDIFRDMFRLFELSDQWKHSEISKFSSIFSDKIHCKYLRFYIPVFGGSQGMNQFLLPVFVVQCFQ